MINNNKEMSEIMRSLPCGHQDHYINSLIYGADDFLIHCEVCDKEFLQSKGIETFDELIVCSKKCKDIWER